MSILDKIERKCSWLSFNGLYMYMSVIFLLGLIINMYNPMFYIFNLSLDIGKILNGQIWRLMTFIFFPPSSSGSIILSLLLIYVYYSITKTLTMMWGNFKFNLYMLIGYISMILGAFLSYFLLSKDLLIFPTYSFFSIIMAFALSFPNAYFYIYFLIPIKAKYFAYFEIALYFISFLSSNVGGRVAIICSAVNVFIFFVLLKNKL